MLKMIFHSLKKSKIFCTSMIISLIVLAVAIYLRIGFYQYGVSLQTINTKFLNSCFYLFATPFISVLWGIVIVVYAAMVKFVSRQQVLWLIPSCVVLALSYMLSFGDGLVKYELKGLIKGIEDKLIADELYKWTDEQISINGNKSIIIDCRKIDMGFISKNGKFQCKEVDIRLTANGYYVNMYWGGGLLGCHGITYGTDKKKASTNYNSSSAEEIISGIFVWAGE